MKTKQQIYNAGLTKTFFKTLIGVFWLYIFYFLWIWASFELLVAIRGSLMMLVSGPLLLFPLLFMFRFLGSSRIVWREQPVLAEFYLSQIMRDNGPRLRLWQEGSETVPTLFWIENPFGHLARQEIFLSSEWLEMSVELQQRSMHKVWREINSMTRAQRTLRSVQIAYWVGLLWPLEIIFWFFKKFQSFLGLDDLPFLSFWVQRVANSFKRFLMNQENSTSEMNFKNSYLPKGTNFDVPKVWTSVLWGPWYQNCSQYKHPLWNFLGFD